MSKAANPEEAAKKEAEIRAARERQIHAAQRLLRLKTAKEDLIEFTRLMMPSPENPEDTDLSRYQAVKHHRIIAAALQEVEKGNILRLIITMPPRAGKTEISSKKFIPWILGKDPYRHVIFASYNETMGEEIGGHVRDVMKSTLYHQIFPGCELKPGSAAKNRIETKEGGIATFVGRGGSITGRGADCLIIDDIVKDREEADSPNTREKIWDWFTQVAMTRLMQTGSRVVIIMTRWHEDDLIGRLTDPTNDSYNPEEAKKWKILALPAIAEINDPMNRAVGEPLWPERFSLEFLENARTLDPKGFSALYQGRPTPEDGDFFKKEWFKTYAPDELPKNLRKYVASDHAVSTRQDRDATVLIPVGICEDGDIWVLSDVWWRRAQTDVVTEAMLRMMKTHKPLMWWAENGHISKSIGPFLRQRMNEEKVYAGIIEVTPVKDKQTRAQSIQGRMSMGKVHFPRFAPWWAEAQNELLKFPGSAHDDFVDALALIGIGLTQQLPASKAANPLNKGPKPGTLGWIKKQSKFEADRKRISLNTW